MLDILLGEFVLVAFMHELFRSINKQHLVITFVLADDNDTGRNAYTKE